MSLLERAFYVGSTEYQGFATHTLEPFVNVLNRSHKQFVTCSLNVFWRRLIIKRHQLFSCCVLRRWILGTTNIKALTLVEYICVLYCTVHACKTNSALAARVNNRIPQPVSTNLPEQLSKFTWSRSLDGKTHKPSQFIIAPQQKPLLWVALSDLWALWTTSARPTTPLSGVATRYTQRQHHGQRWRRQWQ